MNKGATHGESLLSYCKDAIRCWFSMNTFSPAWMYKSLRQYFVGYVIAVGLQVATVAAVAQCIRLVPSSSFPGLLAMLMVVVLVLNWGPAPGLISTCIGTILIYFFILPSNLRSPLQGVVNIVSMSLFFFVGLALVVNASKREQTRRRLEKALLQSKEEAIAHTRELEAVFHTMLMVQAGELASREAQRRMEEFLGVAAHELRTPLTTIKAGIQLAQRWAKDVAATHGNDASDGKLEAMHKLLARAERQVETLNRLIGDLLDISRIQAGKLHMRMVSCDLIPIVRDAVDGQRQLVEHRTILLDIAEQRETVLVLADAERIAQVVTNYLTNALKYSGLDRPVVVSVNLLAEGQCVRVSVRDEGPGLSSEEQEHVWERFHQVERIKVQSGFDAGLGLGLHISRTIIEHHHGEVGVESTPGEGAAFWFTLPVAQSLSSSATTS